MGIACTVCCSRRGNWACNGPVSIFFPGSGLIAMRKHCPATWSFPNSPGEVDNGSSNQSSN